MSNRLGTFRVTYAVVLASIGSFLIGYDIGVVGGVLTLPSFQQHYGYTNNEKLYVESNSVSLLPAGAFCGCFLAWPITSRLGRKLAIVAAAVLFCLGAILQIITNSLTCFYAGRIIEGLGTGVSSVIVPIYTAEIAPKHIRGKLGGCFQLFVTFGIAFSYWMVFAVTAIFQSSSGVQPPATQWRIPIGLQLVPGGLLGLGALFIKESPRWLARKGRCKEAYTVLCWIRGASNTNLDCQLEFQEILDGMKLEARMSGELGSRELLWRELSLPSNRLRLFLAFTLQAAQQCTGNTSLANFAPQMFATVGAGDKSIFVAGMYGIVKIIGVIFFITFLVERIGRRIPFIFGAFVMGSLMLAIGILVAMHPPGNASNIDGYGALAIAMICLEAFSFNWSWGPLVWLYIGEIFPLKLREIGNAVGSSSQWMFNFVFSNITPHAIANMGWKTFLMFAILNYCIVVFTFFFVRETKGRSLEEMEIVFETVGVLRGRNLWRDNLVGPRPADSEHLISDRD